MRSREGRKQERDENKKGRDIHYEFLGRVRVEPDMTGILERTPLG